MRCSKVGGDVDAALQIGDARPVRRVVRAGEIPRQVDAGRKHDAEARILGGAPGLRKVQFAGFRHEQLDDVGARAFMRANVANAPA